MSTRQLAKVAKPADSLSRWVLDRPAKVLAAFFMAGAIIGLSIILSGHGRHPYLVVSLALCCVAIFVYFFAGLRFPSWALHVGVLGGTAVITGSKALGADDGVDTAVFYIWVLVFAALYFAPKMAAVYMALVGIAYAVALAVGPTTVNPVGAWLTVVGTGSFAAVIVLRLTGLLRSDSQKDYLTGLANRRTWDARLDSEIERALRTDADLSIAIIDLDYFKEINDSHGHEVGDLVLREVSDAWRRLVRSSGDFLGRLGGDEFGLLAPGSDATDIVSIAARLVDVGPHGITYSIGVATWDGEESAEELLRRADRAMYREKLRLRRYPRPPHLGLQTWITPARDAGDRRDVIG